MEEPGAENVFHIVREMNRSSQVTIEAFQQQLQFICNLQQKTLEDVSVVRSEIDETLNKSIGEIEHFQSHLLTAVLTSTVKEDENNGLIHTEYKRHHTDTLEEKDYVAKRNLLREEAERSLMVTELLATLDSNELSSDSDQDSDTEQNYNLQYTNTDHCKPEKSYVSFESEGVNHWNFKKQDSYTRHTTEEVDLESLHISNSTFRVNKGGPEWKESEPTLGETVHNKNPSKKKNLEKWFKSMNEEIAGSKTVNTKCSYKMQELESFFSEVDQEKIQDQSESKPLHKVLRRRHINDSFLLSKNHQINRLRTDKTFLHILLSKAEKDAEVCRQEVKAVTDKCEEHLKQRKQIQDERNHLHFEKQLLMKEIMLLKEENNRFLKDLPAANTEKEELRKMLDSSKKMALSYAKEKHKIHSKWKEALMEIYRLRSNVGESRTQHLNEENTRKLVNERRPWSMENI